MAARWFSWSGVLIMVVGIIDLIWSEASLPAVFAAGDEAHYRWQSATGPIFVIGLGVLIVVAAQILDVVSRRSSAS